MYLGFEIAMFQCIWLEAGSLYGVYVFNRTNRRVYFRPDLALFSSDMSWEEGAERCLLKCVNIDLRLCGFDGSQTSGWH